MPRELSLYVVMRIRYGSIMATITLKNIPETLHRALQRQALVNHRSINREAIECLERMVSGKAMDVPTFLDRVRRNRVATPGQLTDELIKKARVEGRA